MSLFLENIFLNTAYAQTGARLTEAGQEVTTGTVGKIAELINLFLSQIPLWIAAAIVFILSIGVSKIVKRTVENRIGEKIDDEHQEMMILAGRISYVGTLSIGITVALKIAGIDLTTLLAAVAFGIGFALRDLMMNFLAGVFILTSRQFTIGDFISVGDKIGKVVEIQGRVTVLRGVDGTKIILPNGDIFSNAVISFTSNPTRRVEIPLSVSYGTDLEYATKILIRTMASEPKALKDPAPAVLVKDYAASSIDLSARFWVGSRSGRIKIRSGMIKKIDKAFAEAGIHIPFSVMHIETSADYAHDKATEEANETKMKSILAQEEAGAAAQKPQTPTATATPIPTATQQPVPAVETVPVQEN